MKVLLLTASFLAFLFLSLFLLSQGVLADEKGGEIASLSVSTDRPIVLERFTVTVGVNNPTDERQNYKLKVSFLKDGIIKSEEVFEFSLNSKSLTSISPTYSADTIGKFDIVVKLTDKFEVTQYDLKVTSVIVISELGPFDISIETPSNIVPPGTSIPVIVSLENKGEKSTDVEINVVMHCNSQTDILTKFYIFMEAGDIKERNIAFNTCNEQGSHDIIASIVVFNQTWISAVRQVFLNQSFIELSLSLPEALSVRAGESVLFDVQVTNLGSEALNNVKLFIPRLPQNWISVTPQTIGQIRPKEIVVFLVNITPPIDANSDEITIGISVAGDQALKREETKLNIISFEGVAAVPGEEKPVGIGTSFKNFSNLIQDNSLYIGIFAVVAIGGFSTIRFLKRKSSATRYEYRKSQEAREIAEKLKKLEDTLKKKSKV